MSKFEQDPVSQQCPVKEQGLLLFNLQRQRIELGAVDVKKRAESIRVLEGMASDPTLAPSKKVIFAETLREVSYIFSCIDLG